jgi:amino acid adenylation domain-containing protein
MDAIPVQISMPTNLPELLRRGAQAGPSRPMVVGAHGACTYAEIAELAGRVASALLAVGVGRGDRVGILLEKSPEALASLFGVMRIGAAYVPIDPDAPPARAARIVSGSGMRVLITTARAGAQTLARLPDDATRPTVALLDDRGEGTPLAAPVLEWSTILAAPPVPETHPWPEPEDLAYILYTSGSTGEPKGVMLTHRAALAFVLWSAELLELRPDDRLSPVAPWHFDLSVFDLLASAHAGAAVVLVPKRVMLFPVNLADFIRDQAISVWYSVPSVLTRLMLHGGLAERQYPRLRHVIFAGEVFPTRHLREVMKALPGRRFFNWYGPTETNVCTWYEVTTPPEGDTPIPIGRACAGTTALAVQPGGTVAAPGEEGELYVAGPTVMSGYWGHPERSAATLGPHADVPDPVRHGYRTGDWVRPTVDGDFHFTGRRDNMVKSRGYRIELGEVEAALYSHPEVEEVVVVAVPDEEAGNLLHAAVVLRNGATVTATGLIAHCASRIPRYMVPQQVVLREQLPRTLNGKFDRVRIAGELGSSLVTADARSSS